MRKLISRLFFGVLAAVVIVTVSVIMTHFINGAGIAKVKGHSMQPQLKNGEYALFVEDDNIERFDMVVAHDNNGHKVVKRVIGLPGEDVAIIEGTLYIDGKEYDETYIDDAHDDYREMSHRTVLQEGEYFVMGDNRDNSTDSRSLGPIAEDDMIGVVHHTIDKADVTGWIP